MGFLEVNLGALSKIEPDLARRLVHVRENQRVSVGEDGGLTVAKENGETVFFPGFQTFQSIPKLSGYGHLKDSDVVIVYGFGVGAHVRELIQATSPKTFILVIDPAPDIFLHALKLNDLSDLFSGNRLSLAIGEDPYQATRVRLENFFGVFTLKNIKVFHCPSCVQLAPDYFEKVDSCVKEISSVAERNRNTLSRFSWIWHNNILENLPEILKSPGIARLAGKFAGKPGIIISAGPSLDRNVKWLAAAKGRAVLICVDTALKTLLKAGIVPDFLVCLDALAINYMHVAKEETAGVCLVANPVTFPQIVKKHKGRIFMMTFNDPLMDWIEKSIEEKGSAITGGSVATAAFDFARKIGASPIFLVGQDLAFTGKRAYTNGSFYCENWMDMCGGPNVLEDLQESWLQQEPTITEKDFFDRPTVTTSKMVSWKRWFEAMLSQKDVRCVHATEGGLFIQGTEMKPLSEAIFDNCENVFDADRVLEGVAFQPEHEGMSDLLARFKTLNKKVERIERVCKEGMVLASGLLAHTRKKGPDRQRLQNGMTRLGAIASGILSEDEFLELNKWTIDVLIEKMQEYKAKSKDGPIQTSLHSYRILLGGIENVSRMLGRKLDESISFLKREEESLKGP